MTVKKYSLLLFFSFYLFSKEIIILDEKKSFINQIIERNVWQKNKPLKLHLGCGQTRFDGYINMDFPPEAHTVQQQLRADIFGDITRIKLPACSLDEVRSHHMFEHFDRPTALALLCQWTSWLKVGAILTIETPDLQGCINLLQDSAYNYQEKQVIIRHLFGSHEASWAYHYDGWYKEKFEHILGQLGFECTCVHSRYLNLCNITVTARKTTHIKLEQLLSKACAILSESLVNSTEEELWKVWQQKLLSTCKDSVVSL